MRRVEVERRMSSLEADMQVVAAAAAAEEAAGIEQVAEWVRWLVGRRLIEAGETGCLILGPGPIVPTGDGEWFGYDSAEGQGQLRGVTDVLNEGYDEQGPVVLLTAEERARALAEIAAGKWEMWHTRGAWYAEVQPFEPHCPPFRSYLPEQHAAYCASSRLADDVALAARLWAAQTRTPVPGCPTGDLQALARWLRMEHRLIDDQR